MPDLKLIALDAEDLSVISAHLQDAVVRVVDMAYVPGEKRFALIANRFDWEKALKKGRKADDRKSIERRRSALRFERVMTARVHGLDLTDKRAALALLAITFEPKTGSDAPGGDVTLTFSGGAAIRISVEYLELEMKDLGAVWSAKRSPVHPDDQT